MVERGSWKRIAAEMIDFYKLRRRMMEHNILSPFPYSQATDAWPQMLAQWYEIVQ